MRRAVSLLVVAALASALATPSLAASATPPNLTGAWSNYPGFGAGVCATGSKTRRTAGNRFATEAAIRRTLRGQTRRSGASLTSVASRSLTRAPNAFRPACRK